MTFTACDNDAMYSEVTRGHVLDRRRATLCMRPHTYRRLTRLLGYLTITIPCSALRDADHVKTVNQGLSDSVHR